MKTEAAALLCEELLLAIERYGGSRNEAPMDTMSVYLGRRFCTGCCKEWGDMEVLLDLKARRTGAQRGEVYLELYKAGAVDFGLCCRRALFPVQRNIDDYTGGAATAISSEMSDGFPSSLAVTVARPRPRVSWIPRSDGPIPLRGVATMESVEAMLEG